MPSVSKMIVSAFVLLNLALPVLSQGRFITSICTSDAGCDSGCCAFNTGKCAGAIVALQRDGGCGFGDAAPNDNAAQQLKFTGGITSPSTGKAGGASAVSSATPATATGATNGAAGQNPPVAKGTQFITGVCTSDADCAAGCCGFNSGKCAGPVVAQQRDGGCGFGDAAPNDNAAKKLTGAKRGIRGWNL